MADGIADIQKGVHDLVAGGTRWVRPQFLGLLAEAHGLHGQPDEGLARLDEALTAVRETGERFCESNLHRLQGELLLQRGEDNHPGAEACFQEALNVARQQEAKSWELRAATSLARLWQGQGKREEARELLAPVYNWFTEGFDTADLKDAKALLDELS